ncbi:unnamed protein product [Lactuca saligna]|uniref:Cysteine-rich transmembrane domain-containing protein n=1 Tax=Lactuca saligna TaxID=75948 RepID=A0AA36A423_LACSI|nr:unnamed protein product [Lactuca saligna]
MLRIILSKIPPIHSRASKFLTAVPHRHPTHHRQCVTYTHQHTSTPYASIFFINLFPLFRLYKNHNSPINPTQRTSKNITIMSYYNQGQPPVGAPPPQGYPPEGYPKDAYPPPGYPPQGYPQQGYPPQYAPQYGAPPPQQQQQQQSTGFMEGCLAALCCCCLLDACF